VTTRVGLKKQIRFMKKNIIIMILVSLATIALSYLTDTSFPILIGAVVITMLFVQLPQRIHSILYVRFSVAVLVACSLFQIESMAFWLLNVHIAPLTYLVTTFIIMLGFAILRLAKGMDMKHQLVSLKPTKNDLIILVPAIAIAGLMLTRAILPQEDNMASIVKSVTYATDDAIHVSILGDLLRSDSNLTADREGEYSTSISANGSYPVGWHLFVSIVASSLVDTENLKTGDVLLIYFVAKVLSLFAAVASLMFFLLVLAERMKQKTGSFIQACVYIALGLGVSSLFILPVYFDGFFSFFPIIIYTMTFAAIFVQPVQKRLNPTVEIILHLLAIASALTWVLTAPILLLSLALRYYQHFKMLRKIPVKYYALLAASGVILSLQVYSLLLDTQIKVSSLATPGGIMSPAPLLLTILLVIYAVFYIRERGVESSDLRNRLTALVIPALLCLAAILLFVTLKSAAITYYYYKMQVVIFVLIAPIACVYIAKVLNDNLKTLKEYSTGILVVLTICILSIPSVIGFEYVAHIAKRVQHTIISNEVSAKIVDTTLDETFSENNTRYYYLYPAAPAQTIIASNVARINYPTSNCGFRMYAAAYAGDIESIGKIAIECSPSTPTITIYTDPSTYEKLKNVIPSSYIESREISINKL